MEANSGRFRPVEVEGLNGLFDVASQLIPGVSLSEDTFGQTLGGKSTVGLLRYLEDNFVHNLNLVGFMLLSKCGCPCILEPCPS